MEYARLGHLANTTTPAIANFVDLGQFRQRDALGDGYVEALRAAYPDVSDSADLVMYWVHQAAYAVASGRTIRARLIIATQSITQQQNRTVLETAATAGVRPTWFRTATAEAASTRSAAVRWPRSERRIF